LDVSDVVELVEPDQFILLSPRFECYTTIVQNPNALHSANV